MSMSKQKLQQNLLVHKNIKSLFFSKRFNKSMILNFKNFKPHHLSTVECSYFIYIDQINTVIFFNPKANYIVPLIFYCSLIRLNMA